MLGFRPDSASVTVTAGGTATQDFALRRDPLQLQTMVVTGTQSPRMNLDASVAVTTLTAQEVEQAAPRSTTEMLRYVPGFTRVESSGGEVNQNISMRGILGVEYVMFMEDGMPVYPTMHTFFMNADNLFRFDENIERMEVVRGGASALFGSNTPGAIINFINKTGGDRFAGTMRATAATQALARYDLNAGGPLGENWRFNVGGFYRYDHGVRDPGYPGIRGGQLKANVTRQLSNGYIRASVKYIDDRNQFILPLPLDQPDGSRIRLRLHQLRGVQHRRGHRPPGADPRRRSDVAARQRAQDPGDLVHGGRIASTCPTTGICRTPPRRCTTTRSTTRSCRAPRCPPRTTWPAWSPPTAFPAGSTGQFFFTNYSDPAGAKLPFNTPNGLVAPAIEWHVAKPISAIQDQLQLRKTFGRHSPGDGCVPRQLHPG